MMIRKIFGFVFFSLLLTSFLSPLTYSEPILEKKQVIIFDLPYLDWLEVSVNYPRLYSLLSESSVGLVKVPESPTYSELNPNILPVLGKINYKSSSITITSSMLNKDFSKGLSPVVVIHGDRLLVPKNAVLSSNLSSNPSIRFLQSKSLQSIYQPFEIVRDSAEMIIFTFGKNQLLSPEKNKDTLHSKISLIDELISRITLDINPSSTLLVICSQGLIKKLKFEKPLSLVLLKGSNFPAGVLYSPKTRKKGIITHTDLRRAILNFINDSNDKTDFQIKSSPGNWIKIVKAQEDLMKNYSVRWPLLTGYGLLTIGMMLFIIIGLLFGFIKRFIIGLAWGYLFLITVPAAFLVEVLFDPVELIPAVVYTLIISGVLFWVSYLYSRKNPIKALFGISFITTGLVVIDGLFNGYLEYKAFLGYSVITGGRYYGIGNEYMGVLLGSYIVGVSLWLQNFKLNYKKKVLWYNTFFIGLILLHPNFGADVGGGMTVLMGLGLTNFIWLKEPIRLKKIIQLFLLTILAIVLAGIWDLLMNRDSMSHLGQLFLAVHNHGLGIFLTMIIRKLGLNLSLIGNNPLTIVLICLLLAAPFLYQNPPNFLKKYKAAFPEVIAGLVGLSITALIGLLVNDSGVISAMIMFMFGMGLGFAYLVNLVSPGITGDD